MSFVNKRYTKGAPFLLKMVCKRIRGGGERLADPLRITFCWVLPLAHWVIITSRSEKLCVLLLPVIGHFMLFAFYCIQLECFHFPCIKVLCPLFDRYKFGYYSCDTSRVSVRPMKTFLHDKLRRKFSPSTLVRENLSNFVKNLQTSRCFYTSGNHGLTESSHQVFNYVAVTKS